MSTPGGKEGRSRSARAPGSSSGGSSASSLHGPAVRTPVGAARAGQQSQQPVTATLSGRNGAFESPCGPQQFRAHAQQLTPCGLAAEFSGDERPPSATATRRSEWSASPALIVDGQGRDLAPDSGRPDFHFDLRSTRSAASNAEAAAALCAVPGAGGSSASSCPGDAAAAPPELWVAKWVDYSSKYGVGYILSDGSIGVYFNDSTKVVLVPDGSSFDYVTRRTQEKPEVRTTHSFEDYPDDLKKKVTLLRHFKNYMHADVLEKKDGATIGESSLPLSAWRRTGADGTPVLPTYEPLQAPYVKKWTRNKHAIMFQLSNKIVQVVFFDRTEAVLSSKSHTVTYVDKRGQVCSYPLSNVLDVPSAELAKRLRYTKDILVNLLGARTADFAGVQ